MSIAEEQRWMRAALELARLGEAKDEVPVGAVVVVEGALIAGAHNGRELDHDPTAHAELLAVREAARKLGRWRLSDAEVYVTLEPCAMCAGMLVNARVGRLIYGAADPKAGAVRSLYQLAEDPRLNHRVEVVPEVLGEECGALLRAFFKRRR